MTQAAPPPPCPVKPDVLLNGPLEVVFFTEQNYTAGSNLREAQKAVDHLLSWNRGEVVSYIVVPEWQVFPFAAFRKHAQLATLAGKLDALAAWGEPLGREENGEGLHAFLLYAERENVDLVVFAGGEPLPWHDEWRIIGCFVARADLEGRVVDRNALLEAAKVGLDEVLDVRLRQLEPAGKGGA